jgi:murein DD-endopeptidase MepM/ murein hydrolase activator NlpD
LRAVPNPKNELPASPDSASAELSIELHAALVRFTNGARQMRASVARGESMPEPQAENWRRVIEKVDNFLTRKAIETSSYDVIRARVSLEAELELDGRVYGNFPEDIAALVFERVGKLAQKMAQVRQLAVKTKFASASLRWPVEPVSVTSPFGDRFHPLSGTYRPHQGVDLSALVGQIVMSSAKGTVIRAEWSGSFGYHVEIQHEGGLVTTYSHLSEIWVEPGDVIAPSETIGLAGNTGLSTGPHLHFEIWKKGKPCDPLEEIEVPIEANGKFASL